MATRLPVFYDCASCHAYCCTYPDIPVTKTDIRRLARHFDLEVDVAESRFTKRGRDRKSTVIRHRHDPTFLTACRFLEPETRRCTVYDARPGACRDYPGRPRCGYYDFLAAERRRQDDPELVLSAWATEV